MIQTLIAFVSVLATVFLVGVFLTLSLNNAITFALVVLLFFVPMIVIARRQYSRPDSPSGKP